jgi:hypothetical protein
MATWVSCFSDGLLANVENDEYSVEGDVSKAARRVLADAIAEILEEKANEWGMDYEVGAGTWYPDSPAKVREEKPAHPLDSLFFALLESAVELIDFDDVAEAVLRQRGKWAAPLPRPGWLKRPLLSYALKLFDQTTGTFEFFFQVGTDDGLLAALVPLTSLLVGPGERADTVVDFSG